MTDVVAGRTTKRRNLATVSAAVAAAVLLVGAVLVLLSRDAADIEPADTTTGRQMTTLPAPTGEHSGGDPTVPGPTVATTPPGQQSDQTGGEPGDTGTGTGNDGASTGAPSGTSDSTSDGSDPGLPAAAAPPAGRAPHPTAVLARTPLPFCGTAHLYETEDFVGIRADPGRVLLLLGGQEPAGRGDRDRHAAG
jgi:hypothetical protein